jgi:HAE1 family hydrophobic/amphiphilic exporter-1
MNFFNFPIKRPITIYMGMLMVILLGYIALNSMPLDLMPDISFPNLVVAVQYEGAGPEEVEERVGKILEAAIKTAGDLKSVKVTTQEGLCFVACEFNWGTDLDSASADVREKIAMVRNMLPDDIGEPVVLRIDFGDMPVLFLHLDDPSGRRTLADLADIARDQVTPQLERLKGVASATVLGGATREIQVEVDRDKMLKYGLSYSDIINAIRYNSLDLTTGHYDASSKRFRVRGLSQFTTTTEIENVIVGNGMTSSQRSSQAFAALNPFPDLLAGRGAITPLRVKDIATVVDTFKERRGLVRIVKKGTLPSEGIGMAVMKETDANIVTVARTVTKELAKIAKTLPAGVELGVSFDLSEIVTDSIGALRSSAFEGGILAALVIFIFLWRIRASLIICTSIPLSLLACFVIMYFVDYTINIMTLGAMVVCVGKLVDDSIVVLDNMVRHLALGETPAEAAEKGFREVGVAVTAATLVAVIIFLPLAFVQGLSAQLFGAFAGTVFFALMASLVVSFTVIPMLGSRWLKPEKQRTDGRKRRQIMTPFQNFYGRMLGWAVDNWGKVLILTAAVMAMTAAMTGLMIARGNYEFIPRLVGGMYRATVNLPPGALLRETDKMMQDITERTIKYAPDYKSFFMAIGETGDPGQAAFMGEEQGMNQAAFNLMMPKFSEGRKTTDDQLRKMWDQFAREHPDADINFSAAGSMDFSNTKPIIVKIYGDDFKVMRRISDDIAEQMKKIVGTRDVGTSLQQGVPELTYQFDRDKLMAYGMPTALALTELRAALGGTMATVYREGGKEYDITVQLPKNQRERFDDIGNVRLASPMGFAFPLRDVVQFQFGEGPSKIKRENSKRVVTVESNKTEVPLGRIIGEVKKILKDYPFPEGYSYEFGGEYEDQMDTFKDLAKMFVAALVLVYLILASLYESLIHPITIMAAIPLAFTGAIAGLFIGGSAFGVTAFIGMIMLVGIVATNSIVLLDFIIEFHRTGMTRRTAIIEAGKTRLRPILMTALTTLFGVVPIAFGTAEGMELQQPLGIVVLGGLVSSTFLTLIVIPVLYGIFDDFAIDMSNLFKRGKAAE